MTKALVVLSGGQDSTMCLAIACAALGAANVSALTFNYGQRHARELQAARDVAKIFGVSERHEILDLGHGILAGTSPLTDPTQQLEQYENASQMDEIIGDRVEKTFVPMRNALFLTIAANRAVCAGASQLYTGVCQADNANYPDCRHAFVKHQEGTINEALGYYSGTRSWGSPKDYKAGYIEIMAPLMNLSKAESIKQSLQLDDCYAALAFTHTAYDGQYPPIGKDHATVLRAQGFEEAGVPDPLVVRAVRDGLMEYPDTLNYSRSLSIIKQLQADIKRLADTYGVGAI